MAVGFFFQSPAAYIVCRTIIDLWTQSGKICKRQKMLLIIANRFDNKSLWARYRFQYAEHTVWLGFFFFFAKMTFKLFNWINYYCMNKWARVCMQSSHLSIWSGILSICLWWQRFQINSIRESVGNVAIAAGKKRRSTSNDWQKMKRIS